MVKVKLVEGQSKFPFCIVEGDRTECIYCPLVVEAKGRYFSLSPAPTATIIVMGEAVNRYKELFDTCKTIYEYALRGEVPDHIFEKVFKI